MPLLLVVPAVYGIMSIITYVAFARDKRAAQTGARRTPELTLHLLELFGGWPGAISAFILIRHKNRKFSYILVTVLIAISHGFVFMAVLYEIEQFRKHFSD